MSTSFTGRRRRGPRASVTIPLAFASLSVLLAARVDAMPPVLQGWLAVNSACKSGPSDDPRTQKACAKRDELGGRLKRRGCEYHEDGDWWRCPH